MKANKKRQKKSPLLILTFPPSIFNNFPFTSFTIFLLFFSIFNPFPFFPCPFFPGRSAEISWSEVPGGTLPPSLLRHCICLLTVGIQISRTKFRMGEINDNLFHCSAHWNTQKPWWDISVDSFFYWTKLRTGCEALSSFRQERSGQEVLCLGCNAFLCSCDIVYMESNFEWGV